MLQYTLQFGHVKKKASVAVSLCLSLEFFYLQGMDVLADDLRILILADILDGHEVVDQLRMHRHILTVAHLLNHCTYFGGSFLHRKAVHKDLLHHIQYPVMLLWR